MHPVLFHIGSFPIHTYGVLIVTGFLLAMYIAYRDARRQGAFVDEVLDFAFWALLGGMVGARLVFIAVNWRTYFIDRPFERVDALGISLPSVLVFWKGGLVFYGAALGGFAAFVWYCRKYKLPMLRFADVIIIGLPLAHAFGRMGCVAAGCCWGDPMYHFDVDGKVVADFFVTASFPDGALAYNSMLSSMREQPEVLQYMRKAHETVPLFPAQWFEAFGELVVFFVLLFTRSRKWFHGQILLMYGLMYPILRSSIEVFRGDAERGYVIPGILSTSQFISLAVATAALVTILKLRSDSNRLAAA